MVYAATENLRFSFLWGKTVAHWVNGFTCFETTFWSHIGGLQCPRRIDILDIATAEEKNTMLSRNGRKQLHSHAASCFLRTDTSVKNCQNETPENCISFTDCEFFSVNCFSDWGLSSERLEVNLTTLSVSKKILLRN